MAAVAEARVARAVAGCDWDVKQVRSSKARGSLDRASAVAPGTANIRPAVTAKLSIVPISRMRQRTSPLKA